MSQVSGAHDVLAPTRLAVALAHAIPDCRLQLEGNEGGVVNVGFHDDASLTPCELYRAVAEALRRGSPELLGRLLGLGAGPVRVLILADSIGEHHVGLGVYRYRNELSWGYVFATTLPEEAVKTIVAEKIAQLQAGDREAGDPSGLQDGQLWLLPDRGIGVALVFSEYPLAAYAAVADRAEQFALEAAAGCAAAELVLACS